MLVGSTHHSEVVFVWKQNYILVDGYFFFCCTWIVNSADKNCSQYVPISLEELQEEAKKLTKQEKKGEALMILLVSQLMKYFNSIENSKNNTVKKFEKTNNSDNLYIDLIEANLSNLNSNQTIKRSNSQEENVLDLEIRETIELLNKISNDELINRLTGSLNIFFNQIGKHVSYENNELIYTDTQLQKTLTLNYSDLSSGERQLIYILLRVALSNGDKSKTAIILMDEPEISLHLNWQAHFIKQLTILNPDAQFIIVTHSPALIMNGWNDVYVNMKDITQ